MHANRLEDRIDRHREPLLAFLRRRVGEDAEELSQEVWLRVARSQACFVDEAAFRAFVFTVARRLLIDHYRRNRFRQTEMEVEVAGGESPENALEFARVIERVELELGQMKPEIAEVFRWRMTERTSFQEIANRQGVGLNTALGRMHRAVQRLSVVLTEMGVLRKEEE